MNRPNPQTSVPRPKTLKNKDPARKERGRDLQEILRQRVRDPNPWVLVTIAAVAATATAVPTAAATVAAATTAAATVTAATTAAAAVAATTATAAVTTTAATRTILTGTRFVDDERTTLDVSVVHLLDRFATALVAHLHETETARAARLAVHEHLRRLNVAELTEHVLKVLVRHGPRQVADIQVHQILNPSPESCHANRESGQPARLVIAAID